MASVQENKHWWNSEHWTEEGNEWSVQYGSPQIQWHGSLLPRIHAFLPAATILEIAPGFGRWTQFLKDRCEKMILVDLSEKCIEACKQRFRDASHLSYHVNDGKTLSMAADASIDFLFSYDSLVHVEQDVIASYLREIARVLTPQGVAFIHHSNLAPFAKTFALYDRLPRGRGFLARAGLVEASDHNRARNASADLFLSDALAAGLKVVSQELINWETQRPIDCISVVTRPGSRWDREYRRHVNLDFAREAAQLRKLAALYDSGSFPNGSAKA